jgi:hypothetical protein
MTTDAAANEKYILQTARNLTKAKLIEIEWPSPGADARPVDGGKSVTVQFNPATLRVTYANQVQTNDQAETATTQHVGRGSSKLSFDLIFDVSMPPGQDSESGGGSEGGSQSPPRDVRDLTNPIVELIKPKPGPNGDTKKQVPPGVRFSWGSFLFDGIIESITETIDLWSEDGLPLRSAMSLGMTQQGIVLMRNEGATGDAGAAQAPAAGTTPLASSRQGDSVQSMASRTGQGKNWRDIAALNNIENPRDLAPGTLLNLNVRASASVRGPRLTR